MKSPYNILGVEKNASKEEIKKAYHKQSKKCHPDVEGGSVEKQQEVNEAYLVLSNSLARQQYDKTGTTTDWQKKALDIAQKIIIEAIQTDPDDISYFFADRLRAGKEAIKVQIAKAKSEARKLKAFLKRMKKAPVDDMITPIINGRWHQLDIQVEEGRMLLKSMNEAKKILNNYGFEVRQSSQYTTVFGMRVEVDGSTGGSFTFGGGGG